MESKKIALFMIFLIFTLVFCVQALGQDKATLLMKGGTVVLEKGTKLDLILQKAPTGLQKFDIQVNLPQKGIAEIKGATCKAVPADFCQVQLKSPESIQIRGLDINDTITAAAEGLVLASISFKGLNPGEVKIEIIVNRMVNDLSEQILSTAENGLLEVRAHELIAPVARAGGPYSCSVGDRITFDGGESFDEDGTIESWHWEVNGRSLTGQKVKFNCGSLAPGDHRLTLTVTDNDEKIARDKTTLIVKKKPPEDKGNSSTPGDKLSPIGSSSEPPQDLDGDGLYEDVDGDGVFTPDDVAFFSYHIQDSVIRGHKDKFDFKKDGRIDYADCLSLASALSQKMRESPERTVISIGKKQLREKKQVKLNLSLFNLARGLRRYDLKVKIVDTAVAEIVGVKSVAVEDRFFHLVDQSANLIHFRAVDVLDEVQSRHKRLELVELTIDGKKPGQTRIELGLNMLSDDGGREITNLAIEPGWLEVRIVVIGDSKNPPQDLDKDGLYEDINGDGNFTIRDVILFGFHFDSQIVRENVNMFDFNSDEQITFEDSRALLELLEGEGKHSAHLNYYYY